MVETLPIPPDMEIVGDPEVVFALSRTIWGEARNQGEKGMQAVANVIGNRASNPGWWGQDIVSVCMKSKNGVHQFSCWNANDPNLEKMHTVSLLDKNLHIALEITQKLLKGRLQDLTKGSDHYLVTSIANQTAWAKGKTPQAIIGDHSFYKLGLNG